MGPNALAAPPRPPLPFRTPADCIRRPGTADITAMPRLATLSLLSLVLAVAGRAQDDEKPFPLPKPAPKKPAIEDAARKQLAKRLCEAIDAGEVAAATAALDEGAGPNVGMGAGKDSTAGRTPLIHAVVANRPELIDLLVGRGARLENGDEAGHTPLMYAALTGNPELCKHLLRIGARPDTKDKKDATAADYTKDVAEIDGLLAAASKGHAALLAALAKDDLAAAKKAVADGASPNANDGKTSLLLHAVRKDDAALVDELLRLGCRPDLLITEGFSYCTPLDAAAEKASLGVLQKLLDAKPCRAAIDDALSEAASSELADRKERVRLLLAAGGNPSFGTLLKPQPLAMAAARGDLETMALLLEKGADQASADYALLRAADLEDGKQALRVVRALLAAGADPNYDHLYSNALGAAATHCHNHVLALLMEDATKETVNTAVGEAARSGNADGLHWLLVKGASKLDLKFTAGLYHPPLIEAIEKGHKACVARLIEAGADVNQEPEFSFRSPLSTAVEKGDAGILEMLLEAGADPRKKQGDGLSRKQSALDVAREKGDEAVIALLEKYAQKRDPLAGLLERAKLSYTDIGDFHKVRYDNEEAKRGQTVWLRKTPEKYGTVVMYELFSICFESNDAPGEELLRKAMQKRFSLGNLVLEQPSEAQKFWRIRYRIDVPADVTPERLSNYLQLAQATADGLEKEFAPGAEDRL